MTQKILSPKSDFIFKLLFGDAGNADILADFLKNLLPFPKEEYSGLLFTDPHLKRLHRDDKLGILDIRVRTYSDFVINIEMQVLPLPELHKRILYYNAKMITEQLYKGWQFERIRNVINITICDFVMFPEIEEYHNYFFLCTPETKVLFSDTIRIDTLELPKVPQYEDGSDLWWWMSFLKAETEEDMELVAGKSPAINKAVGIVMKLSRSEEKRMLEEYREKQRMDMYSRLTGAFRDGVKQGARENSLETAGRALAMGLSREQAA
ncbi:MAG: Rpn family recombination-promoting nuclease/putative transposase, partial [Spirochaetaceae bacterium]|nr:Rpn family recombination-promoting nuclease/putative transposase [Spirochaetaceae bacterium]